MTLEEAQKVAALGAKMKDYCDMCKTGFDEFAEYLNKVFPDFVWTAVREERDYGRIEVTKKESA